jgi:hypothetical protein
MLAFQGVIPHTWGTALNDAGTSWGQYSPSADDISGMRRRIDATQHRSQGRVRQSTIAGMDVISIGKLLLLPAFHQADA